MIEKSGEIFIDNKAISFFRKLKSNPPTKLVEHLKSLNTLYVNKHYIACAIVIRAILDYIPPFFGYRGIDQFLSQTNGKKTNKTTFRKSLEGINTAIRNVADDALHNPASLCEIVKVTKQTIDNQQGNLKNVIEEVMRQLNVKDLRGEIKEEFQNKKGSNKAKSNLEMFEHHIENSKWYKEYINDKVIWICQEDNLYQIHNVDDYKDFSEPWTQVYPDKLGSGKHSVDLMYNNNLIKRFVFVYCDGGRISVAMPQMETDSDKNDWEDKDALKRKYKNVTFFWEGKSLDVKLTRLIGDFYIYENIERVAKISKIEIR